MLQNEWLKARKKLLEQIGSQVRLLSGALTSDLKKYSAAYQSEFKSKWVQSSFKSFSEELACRNIVLGGDFHAYSQSQRLHLRILRQLARPVVLGLECIESKDQKIIDQYMAGKLSEDAFLVKTKWQKRWGFPWENYKPLFDWAKENQIKVVALNKHENKKTGAGLKRRDQHAAVQILKIRKAFPEHLIYVIFGDLHLAQSHLPAALKKVFGFDPKPIVLLQNSEELYFRSVKENRSSRVEWLASTKNRFCQLSSPPWVKWQSYLMFLEQNYDRGLDESDEGFDLTDQVSSLVSFLAKELEIKVSVDDVAVYSSEQISFEKSLQAKLTGPHKKLAERLIREDRSFYIPDHGLMYLSRLSINHAATLAGYFIHSKLSRASRVYWEQPEDFKRAVWSEAVGFFFSKLINHSRKAESLRSLKARLETSSTKDLAKEALSLALEQKLAEVIFAHTGRSKKLKLKSKSAWVYLEDARIVGEMMGDKLFIHFTEDKLSKNELIKYLSINLDSAEFTEFYLRLVKKFEGLPRKSQLSREAQVTW